MNLTMQFADTLRETLAREEVSQNPHELYPSVEFFSQQVGKFSNSVNITLALLPSGAFYGPTAYGLNCLL